MCFSRTVIIVIPLITSLAILLSIIFFISQGSCPEGHFPCGTNKICIKQSHICDGHSDCPKSEDEEPLYCVLDEVPTICRCTDFTVVICQGISLTHVPEGISPSTSRLILGRNNITLRSSDFDKYLLQLIHLGNNNITALPENVFRGQRNLHKLFLFGNKLCELPEGIFDGLSSLSWLFLNNNTLSELHFDNWNLSNLVWLDLSRNLLNFKNKKFPCLQSLSLLYLDWNLIEELSEATFSDLPALKDLSLGWNNIHYIHPLAFKHQINLQELNLRSNSLMHLNKDLFVNLKDLQKLNLGGNVFLKIENDLLSPLVFLRSLDMHDVDIDNINVKMFSVLQSLDFAYFKRFKYCTYVPHVPKCFPLNDGSSSAVDLLFGNLLRVTLWIVAIFTLITNGLVLWHRIMSPSYASPLNFLILSLAGSDLLMGVYLIVIGLHDLRFSGNYMAFAREWMSSWACSVAGVLAMVSCEASILTLLLISAERYLLIAAPLNEQKSLQPRVAKMSVTGIWIFVLILSMLPVFYWRGALRFYGTNSFCFPLHIDDPYLIGWQYSAVVFLGINTFGLLGISLLYFGVFLSVYRTRHATTLNVRDSEFVLRFFFIIIINAFCWVPVIILKILALIGTTLSGEIYGWLAVFVLPINSAVNPILYTFSIPQHRAIKPDDSQEGKEVNQKRMLNRGVSFTSKQTAYKPPKTSEEPL